MSDVLFRREGHLGHLTLNRPEALNALTLDMVRTIDRVLGVWRNDDAVAAVLIDAAGHKAFCAGGDIRALYGAVKDGRWEAALAFFREEYRLNAKIARFPKPIVSVMHGTTMGGGIGIGGHAAVRIVSDRSVFAMPEVCIGFCPDVGGTFLLGTAPGELGTHVALTGCRLDGADAIACGLADYDVPAAEIDALRDGLKTGRTLDGIRDLVGRHARQPAPSGLESARPWIDRCYGVDDAEAIVAALRDAPEPDARKAAEAITANSPGSVKIALLALRNARRMGRIEPCLEQEFRTTWWRIHDADFIEGVRAAVIDKDRSPTWQPARLADVTDQDVRAHFAGFGQNERLGLEA